MTGSSDITLHPATPEDIVWIVSVEARPENTPFIHRWPPERHAGNLGSADMCYLIATQGTERPVAFAILAGLTSGIKSIELARMAVDIPGSGIGPPVLNKLVDYVFDQFSPNRLWLDVFADNKRARRVYSNCGFIEEGVLRQAAARTNGQVADHVIMSILASDRRQVTERPSVARPTQA